jgi:hypothetical protein
MFGSDGHTTLLEGTIEAFGGKSYAADGTLAQTGDNGTLFVYGDSAVSGGTFNDMSLSAIGPSQGFYNSSGGLSASNFILVAGGGGAGAGGDGSVVSVPEPSTLTLLGLGLASMAGYGWRRRKT